VKPVNKKARENMLVLPEQLHIPESSDDAAWWLPCLIVSLH